MRLKLKFRLPYHLILEHDTLDVLDEIKSLTNPKLRNNFMICRCIKFTKHMVRNAEADPLFRIELDKIFGVRSFKQFFFRGGIQ